jgi:hypothetical protein
MIETSNPEIVPHCVSGRGLARARGRRRTVETYFGRFDTEEDAARAYDEAARRLHGELARVNFPRDGERSALHD